MTTHQAIILWFRCGAYVGIFATLAAGMLHVLNPREAVIGAIAWWIAMVLLMQAEESER